MGDFFKKMIQELKDSKKIITAVLTEIDGEEISENLLGEMFLFDEEGIIEFSSDILEEKLQKFMLEEDIKSQLIASIEDNKTEPELKKIELDKDNKLEFFLEPVMDIPRLIVFGAGHIAEPLVKICSLLDFSITVVDDREDFLNFEKFPNADQLLALKYREFFTNSEIKENDYLVIITRGHQYDYQVLKNVIRSKASYIGMIGSSKKIKNVYDKLLEKGFTEEELAEVKAPIGLDIASETPAEIAISIAAEIIALRRGK